MGEITRRPAAAAAASSTSPSRPPAHPHPRAPPPPRPHPRHPPGTPLLVFPLHLVTPHGPGPNTLALALSPQTLTLPPHRLAAAAGPSSSAHSVRGNGVGWREGHLVWS